LAEEHEDIRVVVKPSPKLKLYSTKARSKAAIP